MSIEPDISFRLPFAVVGFFGLASGQRIRSDVTRTDGASQSVIHETSVICGESAPCGVVEVRRRAHIVLPDDSQPSSW
jgi:hypothetical protein